MKSVALALAAVAIGCSTSASTVDNSVTGIPADARFAIGAVTLDPDAAAGQEADVVARARTNTSWAFWVGKGFKDEARKLDIGGGPLKVDIHILKVAPGSEAARGWSRGWGGYGRMVVKAMVATHGEITIKGSVRSGPFDKVCERVGNKVARELNERRGK